jgi:hypothetical protein
MRDYAILLVSIGMIAAGTALSVSGSPRLRRVEEPGAYAPVAIHHLPGNAQSAADPCDQATHRKPQTEPSVQPGGDCASHATPVPSRWPR